MLSQYKNKKVFITGHTGFKGSWLSEWLLGLGADVTGYSLYLPSDPCHFSLLNLSSRIKHYEGDIEDLAALSQALKESQPDIVFHLAAQAIVSTAIEDPLSTFKTNMIGTAHILEAMRQQSSIQAAVMITSDKCYENVEWEFGYRETDALGGKDPYSASKAGSEIVFHSYFRTYFNGEKSIQMATARAGNVIGGGDWAKDRLVPDCVRAWGSSGVPFIRNLKATRPWQHVLEPLSGYLNLGAKLLSRQSNLNGESFNFGPAVDLNKSVQDVLFAVEKHWPAVRWTFKEDPLTQKECSLLKLNCDKALQRLQWMPTLSFAETMKLTIEWYHQYYQVFAAKEGEKEATKAAAEKMQQTTRSQIDFYTNLAKERGRLWTH